MAAEIDGASEIGSTPDILSLARQAEVDRHQPLFALVQSKLTQYYKDKLSATGMAEPNPKPSVTNNIDDEHRQGSIYSQQLLVTEASQGSHPGRRILLVTTSLDTPNPHNKEHDTEALSPKVTLVFSGVQRELEGEITKDCSHPPRWLCTTVDLHDKDQYGYTTTVVYRPDMQDNEQVEAHLDKIFAHIQPRLEVVESSVTSVISPRSTPTVVSRSFPGSKPRS